MLKQFRGTDDPTPLDIQIAAVHEQMTVYGVDSPEYEGLLEKLERLEKLKTGNRRTPISLDTLALGAFNLMGILVIVAYEQKHVMSRQGLSQIIKPKMQG